MSFKVTGQVILVDLDGVLCKGNCFSEKEVLKAKPIRRNIEKVNELYHHNFVVIYTGRRDRLIPATLIWMRKNGIFFQAWSNNKVSADLYIDNRSLRPSEL